MANSPRFDAKTSLAAMDNFSSRHIGPSDGETKEMLHALGHESLDHLTSAAVPDAIKLKSPLRMPLEVTETDALRELRALADSNKVLRSFIGMGYYGTITPPVIQRNILENPGWYTQYTPYQAEIAQGRLEALLNFQTMVSDLTGLPVANASLLDEGTAAGEAVAMAFGMRQKDEANLVFVSQNCHPQTIELVKTRSEPFGIDVVVGDEGKAQFDDKVFAVVLQYPASSGAAGDPAAIVNRAKAAACTVIMATDLLALAVLKSPGELGADIAIGSAQRFGVPFGYGGPHAAFIASSDAFKRKLPGRIVGVSKDREGRNAIRLALQTREQHIRREKATSNICTAQVLLAVMASMYAVYHGPKGLRRIADRVHGWTQVLAGALKLAGAKLHSETFFDTVAVSSPLTGKFAAAALERGINLRTHWNGDASLAGISLDETAGECDVIDIVTAYLVATDSVDKASAVSRAMEIVSRSRDAVAAKSAYAFPAAMVRSSEYLTHPVFHSHQSETEMLRYIRSLEAKDLSLTHSMIPLGSCTMKLNATAELMPITWPGFNSVHPFVPRDQASGYTKLFSDLETWLAEITGFDGISLQPNSGSQGEYAGLMVIRAYHRSRGEAHRDVCLIPNSAHGTNPASAVMAGMKVVVVGCDKQGNVDLEDLKAKAKEHAKNLSALMVTYPSTHGVFEDHIKTICQVVHDHGGQVYMDGANMNAQVGLCRPGDFGPDVCHLNLHKTFCIPHGGGGPGMGPIGVKKHLTPFLPGHPVVAMGGEKAIGAVSAAPWGSASILPISWMYIRMMGGEGLKRATQVAILNANYMAKKLAPHYPVLYQGKNGLVAHECIIDLRDLKAKAGIEVEDVAKRLIDYGFHAPTVSWPVAGTLMIEPTESEPKSELDRFVDAMISIRKEISEIESGKADRNSNVVKNSPHTASLAVSADWPYPYSREKAFFPAPWTKARKFWPAVSRIDNALGDRNLICSCPPLSDY
jgi:glycine dehydrogenase